MESTFPYHWLLLVLSLVFYFFHLLLELEERHFILPFPLIQLFFHFQDISSQNPGLHHLGPLLCTHPVTVSLFFLLYGPPASYILYWGGPWAFPWLLLPEVYLLMERAKDSSFLIPHHLVLDASGASQLITIWGQSPPCWTIHCPMAFVMTGPTYQPQLT